MAGWSGKAKLVNVVKIRENIFMYVVWGFTALSKNTMFTNFKLLV